VAPAEPSVVAVAALSIESSSLPRATRKKRYRTKLVASGGVAPYRWKKIKRKLPKGLRLTRSGLVRGKPKSRGVRAFRVRVVDATGDRSARWIRIRVRAR
jgi:hypothetical protein